jgi:TPR repeat protein
VAQTAADPTRLGYYRSSEHVPQDFAEGVRLFKLAVAQGDADAQNLDAHRQHL